LDSQQTPDHDPGLTSPPPAGGPPPEESIDDAQLSPRAWVARNGPALLLILAAFVFIYYKFGLEGTWTIVKVALGLGAVIFIHELGHFLVAKWCDVHVQTFSIGFGPALPGCSYKWGETTYKLALFPLGGYVKMVGEGGENDEEDTDPRSYKNKTVGQRMAIISAGVVMNVIFGLVAFIAAFKIGVPQRAPVVSFVEAGGPAWVHGVRTGDIIKKVDKVDHPYFEDLKVKVMLSDSGEQIPFTFETPGQKERELLIEPRKAKEEPNPVIGIGYPADLKLLDKREAPPGTGPFNRGTAAADARRIDLKPGDEPMAATDPDNPESGELKLLSGDRYADLAGRLSKLAGKPVRLGVIRDKRSDMDTITLEPDTGFQFGDRIVGTTDPENSAPGAGFNPFKTAPLRTDPRDPQGRHLDYFQFLERLNRLAGQPVVIQVQRKGQPASEVVNVFVPPSYHRVIPGLRMEMGEVTAVRDDSSAKAQGVKPHDTITAVTLTDGKESVTFSATPGQGEKQLDPLRLTYDLRRWVAGREGVMASGQSHLIAQVLGAQALAPAGAPLGPMTQVLVASKVATLDAFTLVTASLKVRRLMQHQADAVAEIAGLKWDNSWRYDEELPLGVSASLAIPELGIAYQVNAQVAAVTPGGYADQKGIRAEDFILKWYVMQPPKDSGQPEKWQDPFELGSKDNPTGTADPTWARVFYRLQSLPSPRLKLLVRHKDGQNEEIELELQSATDWPLFDPIHPRGLLMYPFQDRIARADSLGEAIQMGMRYTTQTILQIYMSLKSLVTRRVSATENLQGPIDIAVYAYDTAGRDWADFFRLLGLISVNLAVVNFLPIPILDGGHMVFLLYEKLRGRPASEHVRQASNVLGLLFLGALMIFVIGLGVYRWIWPLLTG
jgi:membrane-associated protease RseP (regulator of RpoE activity)